MFWFFGCEACGILVLWPGIKPAPPALEGEVLTAGPPGKSQNSASLMVPTENRLPSGKHIPDELAKITPSLSHSLRNSPRSPFAILSFPTWQ